MSYQQPDATDSLLYLARSNMIGRALDYFYATYRSPIEDELATVLDMLEAAQDEICFEAACHDDGRTCYSSGVPFVASCGGWRRGVQVCHPLHDQRG